MATDAYTHIQKQIIIQVYIYIYKYVYIYICNIYILHINIHIVYYTYECTYTNIRNRQSDTVYFPILEKVGLRYLVIPNWAPRSQDITMRLQ